MASEWESSFHFLSENSIDIVCRAQMDTILIYVSPSSAHVLGWLPAEMIGKRCDAFFASEEAAAAIIPAPGGSAPATVRMRKKNGDLAWVEIRSRIVAGHTAAEQQEIVLILRDISERKSLIDRLSLLEGNNLRSGLSTTRALEEAMEREWNRMVRENSQLSLLLLDFDAFRNFHPTSPHFEEDGCLARIAAAVLPILRVTDTAAHYREQQIAILLATTGASGAASVAAKMRTAIYALKPETRFQDRHASCVHIGIASTRSRGPAPQGMPRLLLLAAESALRKSVERDALAAGNRASSASVSLGESARLPFHK